MKLYVGNLAYSTDDRALESLFSQYGQVKSAQVVKDRDTGRSKGFAFVEFSDAKSANAAITGLNGKDVDGRALTVNEARPREERGGGGGGRSGGGYGGGGGGGGYGGGGYGGGGGGGRSAADVATNRSPGGSTEHHIKIRSRYAHACRLFRFDARILKIAPRPITAHLLDFGIEVAHNDGQSLTRVPD